MIADFTYHERTINRMCAVGQTLRTHALWSAQHVNSEPWEAATPLQRNMALDMIRASGDNYTQAWCAWQEHYHNCKTCQEALKP